MKRYSYRYTEINTEAGQKTHRNTVNPLILSALLMSVLLLVLAALQFVHPASASPEVSADSLITAAPASVSPDVSADSSIAAASASVSPDASADSLIAAAPASASQAKTDDSAVAALPETASSQKNSAAAYSFLWGWGDDEEDEDGEFIMVSLGDSYSSGEGVEPFYGQDQSMADKVNDPDWQAHRSTLSWPGRLTHSGLSGTMADHRDTNWFFVAVSGAETCHMKKQQKKDIDKYTAFLIYEYKGTAYLDPQYDIFDEFEEGEIDYVTLTIGGNDVGFSKVVTDCIAGSAYFNIGGLSDRLNNTWKDFYGGVDDGIDKDIETVYREIAERAGEQAEIIVAGYPQLVDSNVSDCFMSKTEAKMVNDAVHKFNAELEALVDKVAADGVNIHFVSVENAFKGHQAYSSNPYINKVSLGMKSEDLKTFGVGSAYSMHPNAKGTQAYANEVQKAIDKIEEQKKNGLASDRDMDADELQYPGYVSSPEDVVLKYFEMIKTRNFKKIGSCFDPKLEWTFGFANGILDRFSSMVPGFQEELDAMIDSLDYDVEVIECVARNKQYNAYLGGLFKRCTYAEVYVKYRFTEGGQVYVEDGYVPVKNYGFFGWRIGIDLSMFGY